MYTYTYRYAKSGLRDITCRGWKRPHAVDVSYPPSHPVPHPVPYPLKGVTNLWRVASPL